MTIDNIINYQEKVKVEPQLNTISETKSTYTNNEIT